MTQNAPTAGSSPLIPADSDATARRLAFLTVGVPTAGAAATIWFALTEGVSIGDLATFVAMYVVTSLGLEVGFHRFFSHRAFAASPGLTAFWGIAGSMAAQGPPLFWVATHRLHHAFADHDGDPHSPRPIGSGRWAKVRGFWHGHVGWLFTVRRRNWSARVPDLLRDPTVMMVNRFYFSWVLLGLFVPSVAGWALTGGLRGAAGGFLWGGLTRICVVDHVTWGVNSVGHTLGSRPYKTRDNSRNVGPLATLTVGGSWHNNHHAQPALARTHHAAWQLDFAGAVIRLLDRLGLVRDVRYATGVDESEKPEKP